ncbi:hypothetical protein ACUXV3_17440 [Roseobacteraceae bacterium NS-SX3]
MRRWLLILACGLLGARTAAAGAWVQERGQGSAAATATVRKGEDGMEQELGFYGDYGLSGRLTLGVDLNARTGIAPYVPGTGSGHALLFLRLPLLDRGGHHIAAETGLGASKSQDRWQPMQRLTLSYGRGFGGGRLQGWLALDASWERRGSAGLWKLDGTLGFNRPGRPAPMLQVETTHTSGAPLSYAVTPALRWPLKGRRELITGVEYRRADSRSLGLEIGLWHRF